MILKKNKKALKPVYLTVIQKIYSDVLNTNNQRKLLVTRTLIFVMLLTASDSYLYYCLSQKGLAHNYCWHDIADSLYTCCAGPEPSKAYESG